MNLHLLTSRFNTDHVQLWKDLSHLLAHHPGAENPLHLAQPTSEYYVALLTEVLDRFKNSHQAPSAALPPEPSDDHTLDLRLEAMERENAALEDFYARVAAFDSYLADNSSLSQLLTQAQGFSWETKHLLLQSAHLSQDSHSFKRATALLEQNHVTLWKTVSTLLLMVSSLKDLNSSQRLQGPLKMKFKVDEDPHSKVNSQVEHLKAQNELLNLRLELYKSELATFYSQKESSCSTL